MITKYTLLTIHCAYLFAIMSGSILAQEKSVKFSEKLMSQENAKGVDNKFFLPLPRQGNVYVVAHRGAHKGIPENSLPAYQKAIDLGADFVEIDVRTTKDGKFVSVHNATIGAYVKHKSGKVEDIDLAPLTASRT